MSDLLEGLISDVEFGLLHLRAISLWERFQQFGDINDENEAIVLFRRALSLLPTGDPDRSSFSNNLAIHLSSRYKKLGGVSDLNEAIFLGREVLSIRTPGHPDRSEPLNNLAIDLASRYKEPGGINDLNEAIVLGREVLSLRTPGHPDRSGPLNRLAIDLFSRYEELGGIDDLHEAIDLGRETLSLRPPGHPDRSSSLNNLAVHLSTRYQQLGGIGDLDEAVVLIREALSLFQVGHPSRSISLSNLAAQLSFRYKRFGGIDDLNEAIILAREALLLCSPGHPGRSSSLSNLAGHLSYRYKQLGGIDDLHEAIVLAQEALSLFPAGHPGRSISLSNLAGHLSSRYKQLGDINDLNEAIVLGREALSLRTPGHPDRLFSLNILAIDLSSRYRQLGGIDDLNEAIVLTLGALLLCPPGHPEHSSCLNNLAVRFSTRNKQLGRIVDLNAAILLAREALSLCPHGHPDRSSSLNNLGAALSSRYNQLGEVGDLNEAIVLGQETLSLCPRGHPNRPSSLNNLAIRLAYRYEQLRGIDNLDEAIVLNREALSLLPLGHPDRSSYLSNLVKLLSSRYEQLQGTGNLIAGIEVKQELFNLYAELQHVPQTVSPGDLSAAKAWINAAEKYYHPTTLLAYETALRVLVQHSAALPSLPHHLGLLKSLSSSLAVDAFSACLRNQSPTKGVELLEQGRAVFWSQLTRLCSPLENVIESGPQGKVLAGEYRRLSSLIRHTLNSPGPDQHDRVCCLNLELQKVVSKIRELPGLSRFLLPSLFSDLQSAARDGPVVIMNASHYSCDALVVFSERDPVHIPLPITKDYVRGLSLRLRTLKRAARKMDRDNMEKYFKIFLRELWDKLVSRIVNVLRTTCPLNSRIWWCPTAEFSPLPLHAASPYRNGQKGISDLYVSSYTTTLTALIHAGRPGLPNLSRNKKHFIGIGQAAAKDARQLLGVGVELDNVCQLVDGLTTFTRVEGEDACISKVADELGKNEWIHLACHGIPSQERPFESAFALRDGGFTIQRIIQCNLQNPEFAYLSACHTTVGDPESPDEAIHLASAMQFIGFRSVIGTMWAVDDSQTNKVVSTFYKWMVDDSGRLDYTRAARALRMAMRNADIPIDQRILYIHLGA